MTPKEMKIEKGVPVPKRRNSKKGKYTAIAEAMEVGDSVVVANRKEATKLRMQIKSNGIRKCTERLCEDGVSVRVWRIA